MISRNEQRSRFTARIVRRTTKPGWGVADTTILLLADVCDFTDGRPFADHIWIAEGQWSRLLPNGSAIAFDARVSNGGRGSVWQTECKLSRPTHVQVWRDRAWHTAPRLAPARTSNGTPGPLPPTARQLEYIALLLTGVSPPETMPDSIVNRWQAAAYIDDLMRRAVPPTCQRVTKRGRPCAAQAPWGASYCYRHTRPAVQSGQASQNRIGKSRRRLGQ